MKLVVSKSTHATSYYAVKSIYEKGKRSSKIFEKIGTYAELLKEHKDPLAYAKARVAELTEQEKKTPEKVVLTFRSDKQMSRDNLKKFNVGYLFLKNIFYKLGLNKISEAISKKYNFKYDLTDVLEKLIYTRIVDPSSKLGTLEASKELLEQPNFELHDLYRSLDVIGNEQDFILSELYKLSEKHRNRKTEVLFYDCTNFYFELEEAIGLKQYGHSKENRPNPIVQMGLLMDGEGIPLSFCIFKGNESEKVSLTPLEKKILQDFNIKEFVVCTDAGLATSANKRFNSVQNRSFITVQSVKMQKGYLKDWMFADKGWKVKGSEHSITFKEITNPGNEEKFKDLIFYKERQIIDETGLEQRLIVTYSIKYRNYLRHIRENQINRAKKIIEKNPGGKKPNQNDPKRFIKQSSWTNEGVVAENTGTELDMKLIETEKEYDGFYAVTTNLDDTIDDIFKVNKMRWEIEESFRIMKTEFKARPIYLQKDNRIEAHFMTCFLALTLYRFLEKELGESLTCSEIVKTLKDMMWTKINGMGYIADYNPTTATDLIHEKFGFRTDNEYISLTGAKKLLKNIEKN